MPEVNIPIEDYHLTFNVEGTTSYGSPRTLLDNEDDLIAGTYFSTKGFTVEKFLSTSENTLLRTKLSQLLEDKVSCFLSGLPTTPLDQYHRWVDDASHKKLIEYCQQGIDTKHLPVAVEKIESRLSEICRKPLTCRQPTSGKSKFHLRLVRPFRTDNNPPHRDVWLHHLKDALNIYFPIAGSDLQSSLPLAPYSHRWKESEIERTLEGALINGIRYTVPTVVNCKKALKLIRPQVNPNEVLVFSPYLIHGGGINLNPHSTRISLEMRFWRK